jgi:predicted nucleotidyltransferase
LGNERDIMTDEVVKRLQEICNLYTDILGKVILFGSYSRNEQNADSDIDLYIEPKDNSMTTARFGANKRYKDFKYTLYDSFPNEFDLLSYGGKRDIAAVKKSPLWEQIEKDGIVIYDEGTKAL